MTLRADHLAGGVLVAFGLLIYAVSGDLPFGTLAFPGSGFLPKLIAALIIGFGAILFLRAREGEPFAALDWSDLPHAGLVLLITGAGIALYTRLGFIVTVALLIFTFLTVIERRPLLHALAYSLAVTGVTYAVFAHLLKTPLPGGPFGF